MLRFSLDFHYITSRSLLFVTVYRQSLRMNLRKKGGYSHLKRSAPGALTFSPSTKTLFLFYLKRGISFSLPWSTFYWTLSLVRKIKSFASNSDERRPSADNYNMAFPFLSRLFPSSLLISLFSSCWPSKWESVKRGKIGSFSVTRLFWNFFESGPIGITVRLEGLKISRNEIFEQYKLFFQS